MKSCKSLNVGSKQPLHTKNEILYYGNKFGSVFLWQNFEMEDGQSNEGSTGIEWQAEKDERNRRGYPRKPKTPPWST